MSAKMNQLQNYLIFIAFFLFSCNRSEDLEWKNIPYEVKIERFDQKLDSLSPELVENFHLESKQQYPHFYKDFIENILGIAPLDEEAYIIENLKEIAENGNFIKLMKDVQEKYPDLTPFEKEIEEAMKRLKYNLPHIDLPEKYISFASGFMVQNTLGVDYLGIGLDMFLGADAPYYLEIMGSYPTYISRRFTAENIVPRVVESYILMELTDEINIEDNFLTQAIEHGKTLYLLDLAIPETADSIKIGYTQKHWEWAKENERSIWDWFIQKTNIYSTDYLSYQKHFSEAPFTAELSRTDEAAPKLGVFIGWQIVKSFMKNNPDITIQEMLEFKDSQAFLNQSKY